MNRMHEYNTDIYVSFWIAFHCCCGAFRSLYLMTLLSFYWRVPCWYGVVGNHSNVHMYLAKDLLILVARFRWCYKASPPVDRRLCVFVCVRECVPYTPYLGSIVVSCWLNIASRWTYMACRLFSIVKGATEASGYSDIGLPQHIVVNLNLVVVY